MLSPRLRFLTAVCVASLLMCECTAVVGSGVHGLGSSVKPGDIAGSAGSVSRQGDRLVNSDTSGRVRCYSGALWVRSACVSIRGGSIENRGPDDYSSTLQDQSQPWWIDSKTKKKQKAAGAGGDFFAVDKQRKKVKSTRSSWRAASGGGGGSGLDADVIGPTGWVALLILPVMLFVDKLKDDASGGGISRARWVKAASPKAKSDAVRVETQPAPVAKAVKKTSTTPKPKAQPKPKPKPRTAPVKKVNHAPVAAPKRGGGGGSDGGVVARAVGKLVPDSPYARALGIIALAVLGTWGLKALESNNLLRASWPLTILDPWQVLTASAWAVNAKAVSIGGRFDGRNQIKSKSPPPVRFFSPAGWAFAIWAPIFAGELLFVALQLLPLPSIRGSWWLSDISPWFAGAMLFQTLWCFSFRPWAREGGLFWLPAVLLGGVAVALGGLHGILREAWFANDMTILQFIAIHVPLSLHFGWITCATLVNLNGYLASIPRLSNRFKLVASLCSVVAAVALGVGITLVREDPIYALVVAWALWAVGHPMGWDDLRGRVDPGAIRTQQGAAKAGALVAAATSASLLGLSIKDVITGAGSGDYDEDY